MLKYSLRGRHRIRPRVARPASCRASTERPVLRPIGGGCCRGGAGYRVGRIHREFHGSRPRPGIERGLALHAPGRWPQAGHSTCAKHPNRAPLRNNGVKRVASRYRGHANPLSHDNERSRSPLADRSHMKDEKKVPPISPAAPDRCRAGHTPATVHTD